MTYIWYIFLAFSLIIYSCSSINQNKLTAINRVNDIESINNRNIEKTDTLILSAIDLSEDVNRFSTKNDEIILLLYPFDDSLSLNAPFLIEKVIFSGKLMEKKIPIQNLPSKTLLFLIEEDSFKTLEQIEPVFRVYYKQIIELQKNKDFKNLRKYLGDDDLLFSAIINKDSFPLKMKGMHMLINFEYNLNLN